MSDSRRNTSPQVVVSTSVAATEPSKATPNMQDTKSTASDSTSIQDLPEELLEHIISYVLINPSPITLREPQERRWAKELGDLRSDSPGPNRRKGKRRPAMRKSPLLRVLLVCKAFYFAGFNCYYSKNTFRFDGVAHLQACKARFTVLHKAGIRRVLLELEWIDTSPPSRLMSIKELSLKESQPLGGDPFEEFRRLDVVCIRCSHTGPGWYKLASVSGARAAKTQIEERIGEVWGSCRHVMVFRYPKDWGILPNR
ncbi:hypothetical protein CLAFUW4_14077 [Fulvia fulva]|uniref:F-box domain-containing protein n=1 Tax=Passalora fulva TaxID=5499 RepID=A0A9Q8UVX5_PASFU|nr:uncharacterized protein CLAFUR5_13915 [Fulvia fulva]KAK4610734.1 hypothetical protein CLAFUR4_14080 [Fulvia fulva]KAK4611233.1 hypothetical protein CLAFUR0_14084 [Fulvia fulva]UJO24385.1 hypothetical protein CLAFUR5_13915 [Fulvia fulva]WPV21826.1 hypothetical protein CLAFUW4_14077 [Fulvia fulva]WPV37155.1 hypothetical protein CLAFUW7_14088 [Fulvia fulva]